MHYIFTPEKIMGEIPRLNERIFTFEDGKSFCVPLPECKNGITLDANPSLYNKEYDTDVIMLKNHIRDLSGHKMRGYLSDAVSAVSALHELKKQYSDKEFGFALDLGAAASYGADIYEIILSYEDIMDVIIWPFRNRDISFREVIRALKETDFDGTIIFDLKEAYQQIPISLRRDEISMGKKFAKYIEWQLGMDEMVDKYEKIVLFGAGAMCENFMKKHGEKHKPLFTCDNNEKLWGASVSGLTIKPPEALRDLDASTVIFVCNSYYQEIKKQLVDMGVKNTIEFYSDECDFEAKEVNIC